ncbi:MAG TPA: hypothetical protein VIL74_20895 [Pyrinomonadaceae bacterium]|jgi:hypothetical protein
MVFRGFSPLRTEVFDDQTKYFAAPGTPLAPDRAFFINARK